MKPSLIVPRRRIELVSIGIDSALQGLGSDPYGDLTWMGLRVPALVTHGPENRYLFQLCTFSIGEAVNARIRGMRMGWSLGYQQPGNPIAGVSPRVVEQWVDTPGFKLPDGNVSWHMRLLSQGMPNVSEQATQDPLAGGQQPSFAFRDAGSPALLFQTAATPNPFYTDLTAYTPPNAGRPWGEDITNGLGSFYDPKGKWSDGYSWNSLDVPVQGPARVAFYCSVQQSDPMERPTLVLPNPFVATGGLSPEEQFLVNFPDAIIWRVAGAMIVEIDDDGRG